MIVYKDHQRNKERLGVRCLARGHISRDLLTLRIKLATFPSPSPVLYPPGHGCPCDT